MAELFITESLINTFMEHLRYDERSQGTVEKYVRDVSTLQASWYCSFQSLSSQSEALVCVYILSHLPGYSQTSRCIRPLFHRNHSHLSDFDRGRTCPPVGPAEVDQLGNSNKIYILSSDPALCSHAILKQELLESETAVKASVTEQ